MKSKHWKAINKFSSLIWKIESNLFNFNAYEIYLAREDSPEGSSAWRFSAWDQWGYKQGQHSSVLASFHT